MKNSVLQHIAGVAGQVAAVLPLLLITIYLSNVDGLEAAGMFTVLVGASAAIFSICLWGLRSLIQLDQMQTFNASQLLATRAIAIVVASITVFAVAGTYAISWPLVAMIVVLRVTDATIDIHFGMKQVWTSTQSAIIEYAMMHGAKLALVAVALGVGLGTQDIDFEWLAIPAAFVAFSGSVVGLRRLTRERDAAGISFTGILLVLKAAFWFALAAGVCAIVTSAPRFSLPWMYSGDELGVIGVTLSISTFFGMAFYTTWIRHVTDFAGPSAFRTKVIRFLAENALIAVLLAGAAWLLLPPIVAFVFNMPAPAHVALSRAVMLASVLFFAGMNTCNLYKATGVKWMEATAYALALAVAAAVYVVIPEMRDTVRLLIVAGLTLLICGCGVFLIKPQNTQDVIRG